MSVNLYHEKSEKLTAEKPRNALIIFCRAPRLGQVKTRLAATRGDAFALGLYRAMLHDTFALGRALAPTIETWAYHLPDVTFTSDGTKCISFPRALYKYWPRPGLRWPQCEGDLGAKMIHILEAMREQLYTNIVLIGSDSPDVPIERIQTAFERLQNHDLVIGPSDDGGFYLLGASRAFDPTIFEGITWSTDSVYSRLMHNVEALAPPWTSHSLPTWSDVDDESDVRDLRQRLFHEGTHAPHTKSFLGTANL